MYIVQQKVKYEWVVCNDIHYILLFDLPNRVFPCLNQFATTVSYSESVIRLLEFPLIIPVNNNIHM